MDEFLKNILDKRLSDSSIFNDKEQLHLMSSIKRIDINKGNLNDSDICFIKKN